MLKDLFYDGRKTASCTTLMKWAKQKKQFVTSGFKAGDIILYDWDSNRADSEHTGIFTGEVSNGRLVVIEGNTGDAVKERLEPPSVIIGAFRPAYENDAQIKAILTWAYAQVGTAENPIGSNNVRYNTLYYGRTINDPKYAWCMTFVWCAFQEADAYLKEATDAETNNLPLPILRRGSKGDGVVTLQLLLVSKGYDIGPDGIDGDFGANTEMALVAYQTDKHLELDGECGPITRDSFWR